MIGYVKPYVDELKVKDLKLYRAYYCAVCTSLSKKYGPLSRLFLSYDATFISIFFDAFDEKTLSFSKARCPLPPFQKKRVVSGSFGVKSGVEISQAASRLKLEDVVRDEKNFKALWAKVLLTAFVKKNTLAQKIKSSVNEMIFLEFSECDEPNEPAEAFGKAVQAMVDEQLSKARSHLLFLVGKWMYLVDALDDLEKDLKKGSYNPYVLKYKKRLSEFSTFVDEIKEREKSSMNFLLLSIRNEFLRMKSSMNKNVSILENIITLGLTHVTETVLRNTKIEE